MDARTASPMQRISSTRPPKGQPMPDYTPDPADVELVAKAIREAPVSIRDGYVDGAGQLEAEARAVLSALAAAGRLQDAS